MNEPTQPLNGVDFTKSTPPVDAPQVAPVAPPKRVFQVGHLVMGLAFACFVAAWALLDSGTLDNGDIRWLLPVPWLVAGAAGLLATVIVGARRRTTS